MTAKPTCNTCTHWSPYAPGLGECLEYAKRRGEAFTRTASRAEFYAAWPRIAAPDTEDTDTCDQHEAIT